MIVSENQALYYRYSFWITLFFYKQHGPRLSPQSCLNFPGFQGSELLNGCLVVLPSNLCLRGIQKFSRFKIDICDQ